MVGSLGVLVCLARFSDGGADLLCWRALVILAVAVAIVAVPGPYMFV